MKEYFDKYFRMLAYYCSNFVNSNEDGEEIAIDTFIELHKRDGNIKYEEGVRSFLFGVAKHKCLNLLTRRKSRRFIKTTPLSESQDYANYCEINAIVMDQLYTEIDKEVDGLSIRQKEVIKLYLAGESPSSISEKLGIKYKTVCNIKDTAVSILKKRLSRYMQEHVNT